MPAPGQQHSHVQNPFEEARPRLSLWTAQEIATLQSRLDRQLGPEYLSARTGPSGQKVHYVAADKIISLANEVFGFNGWSTSIQDVQVDFADVHPQTGKISLGLSVVVRVTLRDGTFHEDMGYGHIENCKSKASAFEKAKKEGTTDALKRALRHFGNLLGNCIYDKAYLAKVTKIKVAPTKFDEDGLHRHGDFIKKEKDAEKPRPDASTAAPAPVAPHPDSFDDFLGELDEADFCVMEAEVEGDSLSEDFSVSEASLPAFNSNDRSNNSGNRPQGAPMNNNTAQQRSMPPPPRQQPPPPQRQPTPVNNQPRQPQTPNAPPGRPGMPPNGGPSHQGNNNGMRPQPQPQLNNQGRPQPQQNNQGRPQPQQPGNGVGQRPNNNGLNGIPQNTPPMVANGAAAGDSPAFFSARAVPRLPEDGAAISAVSGKPFDPKAESPSIRKTPGIDHSSSRPVSRTGQHVAPISSSQAANDKPPQGAGAGMRDSGSRPQPPQQPPNHQSPRPNVLNPQIDHSRRIGAPGGPGSPLANRGQYKPLTMKRPPLAEVSNAAPGGPSGDAKRIKFQ